MAGRSRYDGAQVASAAVPDGAGATREVAYLLPRTPRDPATVVPLAWHRVVADDRLDLVAHRYLGDPPASGGDLRRQRRPRSRRARRPGEPRAPGHRRPRPGGADVALLGPAADRARRADGAGAAARAVLSRLRSVTVTETDEERSAFTLTLDAGRSGPLAAFDTPCWRDVAAAAGARVVLVVTLGRGAHRALRRHRHRDRADPGDAPGQRDARRRPGEDVSLLLDREERDVEHPGAGRPPAGARHPARPYAAQRDRAAW